MKKILSLVLAVVMIMAMTIPAFAATPDEVAPCACTTHSYGAAEKTADLKGAYIDSNYCYKRAQYVRECTVCGYLDTYVRNVAKIMHPMELVSASCDGTTQTWCYTCSNCIAKHATEEHVCALGPHTGSCPLPI